MRTADKLQSVTDTPGQDTALGHYFRQQIQVDWSAKTKSLAVVEPRIAGGQECVHTLACSMTTVHIVN